MKKRKIPLMLAIGIGLILVSLCVTLVFQLRMHIGTQKSHQVVSKMDKILPERTPGVSGVYMDAHMPVLEIDGVDYVAMIEVPAFGTRLPVADQWISQKLFNSPARFSGSAYDQTLVIGGADYGQQFAFCDRIQHEAIVVVTDMTGAEFTYAVLDIDRSKHAESQWLLDGDCDLTLFCRDMYSMEYIAVRCVRVYN